LSSTTQNNYESDQVTKVTKSHILSIIYLQYNILMALDFLA